MEIVIRLASEHGWNGGNNCGEVPVPPVAILDSVARASRSSLCLSLACGIAFGPLWYWGWKWTGVTMLALHVLLDGIDGPLARYQQIESPRGSFTDSFCDQAVVTVVAIALMMSTPVDLQVLPGALFIALYIGVLTIAMIRNSLNVPYSWLVRPRFFFFAAIPLHVVQIPYVLVGIVWISNILLLIKLVSGFFRLKQRLRGPKRFNNLEA